MTTLTPKKPVNANLYQYYYPTEILQDRLDYFVGYLNSIDSQLSDTRKKDITITIRELIYELNYRKAQELETGKTWEMNFTNINEMEEMREILKKQYNSSFR